MQEQNIISRPEFVVTDSEDSMLAKLLEQDIFARPEAYRTILVLGSLASFEASEDSPIDADVIKRVDDFFKYRIDRDVAFDEETESILANDTEHSGLIRAMSRTQSPELVKERRDRIRQNRLAFFVDRVIEWQEQKSSHSNNLRPAG